MDHTGEIVLFLLVACCEALCGSLCEAGVDYSVEA